MARRNKEQWQTIINDQQQSGMSVAQFCRKENIDQKYFSTRKRRLIKESKAVSSIFTQVKIKQTVIQDIVFEYQHKSSTIKFNQLPNAKWLSELMSTLS